jgi:membrane fusion protein, multidrug efflux system
MSASLSHAHSSRRRRAVAVTVVAVTVVAAAAALSLLRTDPAAANAAAAPSAPVPVSVAEVRERVVETWSEHSGRFEAVERVELRARVAGAVSAVHFREGTLVKAGELLLTVDPAPYAAAVERAYAQLAAAQSRVAHTAAEAQRAERLWAERAIAEREADERRSAAQEAQAQAQAAEAALRSARLDLGYTQLRAPVAGRMGRLEVTPGNLVSAGPGSPVLATLVSVSPIYASFDAHESVVTGVLASLGGAAQAPIDRMGRVPVQAEVAGRTLEGQLQLVDNQVDARSGTVRVRATFDNADGALMPGQFAKLRLGQPAGRPALLINERAVGTDQSKRFVMVVGDDRKALWREVTLGASVGGLRIVTNGLQAGERIVVNGLQRVTPGATVAPSVVAMDVKPEVTARTDAQAKAGGDKS